MTPETDTRQSWGRSRGITNREKNPKGRPIKKETEAYLRVRGRKRTLVQEATATQKSKQPDKIAEDKIEKCSNELTRGTAHACRKKKRKVRDRVHALSVQGGKEKEEAKRQQMHLTLPLHCTYTPHAQRSIHAPERVPRCNAKPPSVY